MEKLLLILVIVVAVIAVAQMAKVYQLSTSLGKKREEDVSPTSNKVNGNLLLAFVIVFFLAFIYLMVYYRAVLLPVSASEHGVKIDQLLNFNWILLLIAFFIVNFLLFYFAKKYSFDPNRRATYIAHNNTLELVWTVIPAIVLAVIIIYGLRTWNQIMDEAPQDAISIELYAKQFDWSARFAGSDQILGEANFTMITADNPLGLITQERITAKITELSEEIEKAEKQMQSEIMPNSQLYELEDKIGMRTRQRARVINFKESDRNYSAANDDKIVKGEMHIPVNKPISLHMRAQDVIHSAYLPHFRVQMNAVPGMTTKFHFTPTVTTDSMRIMLNDPQFNYLLLCNKVCGSAHYNMQMNVVVDTEEDYKEWLAQQKAFVKTDAPNQENGTEGVQAEEEDKVAVK